MESFARLLAALLVGVLVVQLVQHGPGGATKWLRAKFLGETS